MSDKVSNTLGLLMRFSLYISGFSILFAIPSLIKYGNFSHNQVNLNTSLTFLVLAVVLFTVNNIVSKKFNGKL
jgi:low affinity Fe/Cu permease